MVIGPPTHSITVVGVCSRHSLSSVTLSCGPAAGHVGGRVADTARRASTVMSR